MPPWKPFCSSWSMNICLSSTEFFFQGCVMLFPLQDTSKSLIDFCPELSLSWSRTPNCTRSSVLHSKKCVYFLMHSYKASCGYLRSDCVAQLDLSVFSFPLSVWSLGTQVGKLDSILGFLWGEGQITPSLITGFEQFHVLHCLQATHLSPFLRFPQTSPPASWNSLLPCLVCRAAWVMFDATLGSPLRPGHWSPSKPLTASHKAQTLPLVPLPPLSSPSSPCLLQPRSPGITCPTSHKLFWLEPSFLPSSLR